MSDPTDDDMDHPITKREAIELFLTKDEARELFLTKDEARELFLTKGDARELLLTKGEAREMFANFLDAVLSRMDERFVQQEARIQVRFEKTAGHLVQEIRSQASALDQDHLEDMKRFEDKYRDLPERVTKLEAKVFAPKRQRRR